MARKSGNTGHRLNRTRAASSQIVAKKKSAQRAGKMNVRFVCPVCGGPHSKADHGKLEVTPAPAAKMAKAARRRPRKARNSQKAAWEHAALNAAFESRVDDPAS